jgi:hypothetical protein
MARCDQGYLCEVCGDEVEDITQSDLYLRYVIGELEARALLTAPERHIACHPFVAQFILDERFPAQTCEGPFHKGSLDDEERKRLEDLYTRGWQRLQEVRELGVPISEYPLEDCRRVRPTADVVDE